MQDRNDVFVLGINGSPHKDGVVSELLSLVLNASLAEKAETETLHLYDLDAPFTPGHYSKDPTLETPAHIPPNDITETYPKILRADVLVFATPVYWANMSAAMKNFIEYLTPLENDGFQLHGKVAVCIAASKENEGGVEMAALSLVAPLTQMGMLIPPDGVIWHPSYWATAEKEHSAWAMEDAPKVGKNVVQLVRAIRDSRIHW